MSDAYQKIENIPILEVLDKLGISYSKVWSVYMIHVNGKATDWWVVNIAGNFVNDFSHDRPKWWPRAFVKHYLKIPSKEVYQRFETHFGITDDYKPSKGSIVRKLYKPKITYTPPF